VLFVKPLQFFRKARFDWFGAAPFEAAQEMALAAMAPWIRFIALRALAQDDELDAF
jgi:hypothetical protein